MAPATVVRERSLDRLSLEWRCEKIGHFVDLALTCGVSIVLLCGRPSPGRLGDGPVIVDRCG
jgi:hypothetical protein